MNASALLIEMASTAEALKNESPGSRQILIAQSHALIEALELPSEFVRRTFWAEPAESAAIHLAIDINLFQHLKETPRGSDLLAIAVDPGLIRRLARH
ncbi:unnamed protein product [Penicillium salamii]|uniref:Uncharacterized protein n=1 Tax=Penicillium salamii TaxID=1612424 RepID=A0A9W4JXP6_9EURO|nr:unnamed protein product [Penicillium salamii]